MYNYNGDDNMENYRDTYVSVDLKNIKENLLVFLMLELNLLFQPHIQELQRRRKYKKTRLKT